MARLPSPTDRSDWAATAPKESYCCTQWRRHGLWKSRGLEKSQNRLSHPAWKSRKMRGIPTFPQPRRRQVKLLNRTFHVLQKADILTCYGQRSAEDLEGDARNPVAGLWPTC